VTAESAIAARPRRLPGRAQACLFAVVAGMALGACAGDDADTALPPAPATETRTIAHAIGSTEVPAAPERVVVLDTPQLDAVVALGATPVGAVRTDISSELPSWIGDVDDIAEVGTIQKPNLEAIAALRPDLILSSTLRHEDLYELAAIAPTVFAETVAEGWKENLVARRSVDTGLKPRD